MPHTLSFRAKMPPKGRHFAWESVHSSVGKRIAAACFAGLAMTERILQRALYFISV